MKERKGNMWDALSEASLFLITTNGSIKRDGSLVMGRGIALECATRYPDAPRLFADAIRREGHYDTRLGVWTYGMIPGSKLGLFQVKYAWNENADELLIALSVMHLQMYCDDHPDAVVHLNYPGIGNGHLDKRIVETYVSLLPDNVTLWEKS